MHSLHCYIGMHARGEEERTIDAAIIEEYVQQVQDGDAEAFIPIAREYQRQLFVYCCRLLGTEQDAEDAVQEIFLKAYQSISGYKATVSFNAWLYKIAYHHCVNLLHRRQLSEKLGRLLKGQIFAESAEQEFLRGTFSEPLSRALVSLPAEDRSLLVLYVFHDKTYTELGEITGKTPEAIRKKLTRIRKRVKETMITWQGEEQWEQSLIQSKS